MYLPLSRLGRVLKRNVAQKMVYCARVIKMSGYRNRYEINDAEWQQVKNLVMF